MHESDIGGAMPRITNDGMTAMKGRLTMGAILAFGTLMAHAETEVDCVGIKGPAFVLVNNGRTGMFRLAGVQVPSSADLKVFARCSYISENELKKFLPTLTNELQSFVGKTMKILGTVGRDVWLEDSAGQPVSCELLKRGLAIMAVPPPAKYTNELYEALAAAEDAGLWKLPNDPSADIKIKCSGRTEDSVDKETTTTKDDTKTKDRQKPGSSTSRTTTKTITQKRMIDILVDGSSLKRKAKLTVKYQFKLVSFVEGKESDQSSPNIQTEEVVVMPGETRKLHYESEEVTMEKSSGSKSGKQGTTIKGEAVNVCCGEKVLFSVGTFPKESSSPAME